jgi:hypothetical protein
MAKIEPTHRCDPITGVRFVQEMLQTFVHMITFFLRIIKWKVFIYICFSCDGLYFV